MAKHTMNTASMGEDGIGMEMETKGQSVERVFTISSTDKDWPVDEKTGKKCVLQFKLIADMTGVKYAELLDDAMRTKIIRLQAALRDSKLPYEDLVKMSKEPIRRTYANIGEAMDSPQKLMSKATAMVGNLTPEQRKALAAALLAGLE